MARKKRSSRTLDSAYHRLKGLQSIDEKIVLDGGVSAQGYIKTIEELRQKIDAYNRTLSAVDDLYVQIAVAERSVAEYSEKVLVGVAARFGKDSSEYNMTGGVRKSDRKRPSRKRAIAIS